ncbi:hypothetical protein XFF6990_130390 [Xanthomonas citri pv. fuscans]|uniref:Uncharacterized protein n=1 Tax=Xanthomonas campestris pv. phaseoli TaxID=317013 RepID=A0A7Z7J296_XANCH|nr:hypothetical protein XFF6990_130390 [Xanthomonas citri pv. fuscans]SOO24778.1 hypothetical protein XFF6991_410018 [Xanthomonas phaseoli pv. phaseoli]
MAKLLRRHINLTNYISFGNLKARS